VLTLENKQLIKKQNVTIFDRIKTFFRNIFIKRNTNETVNIESVVIPDKYESKEFEERLKVDVDTNKEYQFRKLCTEIENNPEKIKEVSDDMLDEIIEHYKNIVDLNNKKIQELTSSLN